MKTTLMIPAPLYRRIKRQAMDQRQTISHTVAEILEAGLRAAAGQPASVLPPLPVFPGRLLVDIADRRALYDAMDRSRG